MTDTANSSSKVSAKTWLLFIVPSLVGTLFFLTPFQAGGQLTIGMAYVGDIFIGNFKPQLSQMAGAFTVIAVILTFLFSFNAKINAKFSWLAGQLTFHPVWFPLRLFGCIAAIAFLTQTGPEWLIGAGTSGTTLGNLIPITMTYLGIATVFLPLLVDFGLMEMVGVLMSKIFLRLFKLPGRSAIDAIASWMGSGPVGVFITSQQYERGFYTAREASVICTNFSVVSVSFALVVIDFIGLSHLFVPYYLSIIGIGFVAAMITPKLPPLNKISDTYIDGSPARELVGFDPNRNLFANAIDEALKRAEKAPSLNELIPRIGRNVTELWIGIIPVVMGMGTAALILAEYTPLFDILGYPFVPLLNLFQIDEAQQAAPLMLVGFTDMFLPALVGASIESEVTRFVVATVSITQLIYMSEVGAIIIKSKIPLGFLDISKIFLWRTAISIPLSVLIAQFVF